jgi:hypothetical protein
MTRLTTATAVALVLGSGIALAAPGWSAFEPAFPIFPCADGWSACLVDGQAISPDMTHDTTGAVTPSDMRVGWFDLQPTATFSPFTSLSIYPTATANDNANDAAADAEAQRQADEEKRKSEQASEEKRQADEAAKKANEAGQQADAEAKRAAQERAQADANAKAQAEAARKAQEAAAHASADQKAKLEAEAKAQALAQQKAEADAKAKAAEQARLEADQKAKQEAAAKAQADAQAKAAAEAAQKKAEEDAKKAAADAAAKKAAEDAARVAAAPPPPPTVPGSPPATTGGDAVADASIQVPEGPVDCSSLTDLEPVAMLGKMTEGQVGSCQSRLEAEPKMTEKDKISRVLMANAWAKGDKKEWEKLAKYHLEEIEQSDPDLCYKYALRLASGGVSRAPGVIHWADVALENRTVWTGDEYVSKVYGLYKMKAAAAQQMWAAAEAAHAANPTDESAKKVEDTRNQTKVFAREWYEYAKASGKDKTPAQQLCMSAAGTADYCEGE